MPSDRVRNVCFTLNNPEEGEEIRLAEMSSYIIIGKEVGEQGTPHLQGYAQLKNQMPFPKVKDLCPRAHFEKARGTPTEASDYCKKEGNWAEAGTMKYQGQRTDIAGAVEMVKNGKRMREVADAQPLAYCKYHKGLEKLQKILIHPRSEIPEVKVWWGATGTGKTARAIAWLPDAYIWTPANGKWFENYEGEKDVIFDEFRGQLPYGQLLNLLDQYKAMVEFKGGMCQFAGVRIAITSPLPPGKWYKALEDGDRLDQLLRRISYTEQTG